MSEIVQQARRIGPVVIAMGIVFGIVADVNAYPQRRGRMVIPQPPANIDSSSMIEPLNKALTLLNATDRDYDGHREKAISHIHTAISDLQVPNANAKGKGQPKSDAGAEKGASAKPTTAAPTTPQADSDATLSKALKTLYSVYHELEDKASTRGRIHAKAQVLTAIQELVAAQKSAKAAAAPAAGSPQPAPAAGKTAK
jgi:hypothetical protein